MINVMGAYAGFERTASVYVLHQTGCMLDSRVFCQSILVSWVWPLIDWIVWSSLGKRYVKVTLLLLLFDVTRLNIVCYQWKAEMCRDVHHNAAFGKGFLSISYQGSPKIGIPRCPDTLHQQTCPGISRDTSQVEFKICPDTLVAKYCRLQNW